MPTEFTPVASLLGGGLIGLSATLLMLSVGRVAGATGIVRGLLFADSAGERLWRLVMVLGMVTAAPLLAFAFDIRPNVIPPFGWLQIITGGLIVGFGVSMASGCTSGHGICGLARLSPRSLVAVVIFMGTAFVTVFIIRHVLGA